MVESLSNHLTLEQESECVEALLNGEYENLSEELSMHIDTCLDCKQRVFSSFSLLQEIEQSEPAYTLPEEDPIVGDWTGGASTIAHTPIPRTMYYIAASVISLLMLAGGVWYFTEFDAPGTQEVASSSAKNEPRTPLNKDTKDPNSQPTPPPQNAASNDPKIAEAQKEIRKRQEDAFKNNFLTDPAAEELITEAQSAPEQEAPALEDLSKSESRKFESKKGASLADIPHLSDVRPQHREVIYNQVTFSWNFQYPGTETKSLSDQIRIASVETVTTTDKLVVTKKKYEVRQVVLVLTVHNAANANIPVYQQELIGHPGKMEHTLTKTLEPGLYYWKIVHNKNVLFSSNFQFYTDSGQH